MIKIELVVTLDSIDGDLTQSIANMLNTESENITSYEILKKSLDARRKSNLHWVISIAVELKNEAKYVNKYSQYIAPKSLLSDLELPHSKKASRVGVVGSGPAGLFAALTLIECGHKPIIFERGAEIDTRIKDVELFESIRKLNPESNIQFGEGGAGTFSDGKLNTGLSDSLTAVVIGEFIRFGAPIDIGFIRNPHIGTDFLRNIVKNIRAFIISRGGEIRFNSKVLDLQTKNKCLLGLNVNGNIEEFDKVIFAIGHSARDTYSMLYERNIAMETKPFSMGVRIEHEQRQINKAQYGDTIPSIPPADYKLSANISNKRSIYTFCMCPGGSVVCGASEHSCVVTNGMSEYARDKTNANSAVLINVTPADFGDLDPLAGMRFQRQFEKKAYDISNDYLLPVQRVSDFLKNKHSINFGAVLPSCTSGTVFSDLRACLPKFVIDGLKEGLPLLNNKLNGFINRDAILLGVETRSSAPLRILRNENGESVNLSGLYPCGEGSGYAGGITSSAIDGIKAALKISSSLLKTY
ncbi:MAG: hypothetical protein LBU04_07565 [Christensenellaceae bacterium]|jgi:uncharacterized FAD-dependent dehydrogenase|nr:hypothetical protein [Christensenellaceae bacterium]